MAKKVIILGGGVAGLSAAHELIERGFEVDVYEINKIPGGKARSIPVPGSETPGHLPLPGEHGFRFFPKFYRHVTDTMKRIPFPGNAQGVFTNLVGASRISVARFDQSPVVLLSRFPGSLDDLGALYRELSTEHNLGLSGEDITFFAERIWQILTSCQARRKSEYEGISWWEFTGAGTRNTAYQKFLAQGLTRSLVAAKAEVASTKTIGNILVQLLLDLIKPGESADRLLNGPTNETWIDPWLLYLRGKGVKYHHPFPVKSLSMKNGLIDKITLEDGSEKTGDYFLAALPVEIMEKLLTPDMETRDPGLQHIHPLAQSIGWMNGIQFYLNKEVSITHGHTLYVDSPWALTSVSQKQFWSNIDLSRYGNGQVKGIISVDISDWDAPGLNGKAAKDCTREEVKDEVWAQLKKSLNVMGETVLADGDLIAWFLDPGIILHPNPHPDINLEPLLINKVNTWALRPEAYTRIPNFFLAADYVRTNTDLATMEGANEAARRAVNAILGAARSFRPRCRVWSLEEPAILLWFRFWDRLRFALGRPWKSRTVWIFKWLQSLWKIFF